MSYETRVSLRKGGAIRQEEMVSAHPLANPLPVWQGVLWSCSRLGELLCSPPPFPTLLFVFLAIKPVKGRGWFTPAPV